MALDNGPENVKPSFSASGCVNPWWNPYFCQDLGDAIQTLQQHPDQACAELGNQAARRYSDPHEQSNRFQYGSLSGFFHQLDDAGAHAPGAPPPTATGFSQLQNSPAVLGEIAGNEAEAQGMNYSTYYTRCN